MQEIAATEITAVTPFAHTITPKNTRATGKIVRNAGSLLKRRFMFFMGQTNSTSKNWKILPPTYPPNVQDAAS
jgi:hypothetical protein